MIEFAEPRVIRTAAENDIELLQTHVPKGDPTLHAKRYEQQKSGDATYLIAVQGDIPIGHALLKWKGATDEPIAGNLADPTPDVEDLFVHEAHRNRRVGSRLLEMAERLAREREYKQIGLSCGADNTDARALYTARGYLDSGIAPYTLSGKYKDAKGADGEWTERDCTYFLLPLVEVVPEAATETNMENNNTNTAEETPQQTTLSETNTPPKTPEKPVSEQVVDFAFGVALTAAEALEKAVRSAQSEAPAVWEALQEKGRPARQKLVQSLREETQEETDAVAQGKVETTPSGDGDTPAVTKPVEPTLPIKPAPRPFGFGRIGSVSAEDEIKALEDRVKTLEREVVSPSVVVATNDAPLVTEEAVNVAEQTSAEKGTALVDFTPESSEGDALTNSPYAITDDEERAVVPSQTGEFVPSMEAESSPETVAALVDGAESPETEVADGETKLAPAKGKRSKKTTSEASAGTDPADDSNAMTVEELEA
ncbi:MAG: GNAT family N-acetyltransferase [Fibrella sp.]|nr:GNAT family N-acetyltransferase [Armatimonadota bacterium]